MSSCLHYIQKEFRFFFVFHDHDHFTGYRSCVCVCVCVCVKSLQLCPSLCDPMDCSPPGYSILGFSSKNTGVDCHALLQDIFLIQGSNLHLLCLLLWQVYSLPIALPGKAICRIFLRLGFLDTDFAS